MDNGFNAIEFNGFSIGTSSRRLDSMKFSVSSVVRMLFVFLVYVGLVCCRNFGKVFCNLRTWVKLLWCVFLRGFKMPPRKLACVA